MEKIKQNHPMDRLARGQRNIFRLLRRAGIDVVIPEMEEDDE